MAITSLGAGSGLDLEGIVTRLMELEQRPITLLDNRVASFKSKLSAYGSLKSALSSLDSAMSALAIPDRFDKVSATGGGSAFSASATPRSAEGSYSIEVQTLARAQKLASNPFAATSTSVGSGTVTIEFGSYSAGAFSVNPERAARSITISPANSSLAGVRDAINAADAGVTASIVNDGSGPRLVLASGITGTAGAMRVTIDDDDGNDTDASGLSSLAYDASTGGTQRLAQTTAAADAAVVIDGITVVSGSNTLDEAIDGVTLNLLQASPGTSTTLELRRDTASAKSAVESFVKAYNDVGKALRDLTGYSDGKGSTLQGDATTVGIQRRLREVLGAAVGAAGLTTLNDAGIKLEKDGTLVLDSSRLNAALADPAKDVAALFAAVGRPSDPQIRYISATGDAPTGTHAITVTQLATRGSVTGSAPAGTTITAGVNDTLEFSIDGAASTITLAAGTWSPAALAAMVGARINGASAVAAAGSAVQVGESGGVLTITSERWGSASKVAITGGNALAGLFGTPASTDGLDVAGSIGGVPASGNGRDLARDGLVLRIDGGATGARGEVTFSRGYAALFDDLVSDILGSDGTLAAREDGINDTIKQIDRRKLELAARAEAAEARMRAQFVALDTLLASMNSTSSYLTQQLAALSRSGN